MPKSITPLLVPLFVICLPAYGFSQNCTKVLACPNGNVIVCDITNNDSLFWNAPAYTWSPSLGISDLPEASADFSLAVRDTCPGVLSFRFTLFFDLDGDNVAESAWSSTHLLPAGQMLFGNAYSPGYTGVDTFGFDNRPVPDSLKFRFVVETQQSGDTTRAFLRWVTDDTPNSFYSPRFPEGRHRIFWTAWKNGLQVASCEQSMKVKDCMAPQVECRSGWNAGLPANDTLWLSISDFLHTASDNSNPAGLLEFSLRRYDTGTGFPLDSLGAPVNQLGFTCADLGLQFVELWVRDLTGNSSLCAADFALFDFLKTCDAVDPLVCATTIFVNNDTIQNVRYKLETVQEPGLPPVYLSHTQLPNGCVELPDFSPYFLDLVAVTPSKNDEPLNGVSTYDLVLMNKHILGIQLFNKTWKFLAADANNSGSLSTFDIIELRKLILGVYDSLPNSSSWKFIIADCALDSLQPYQFVCPGTLVFDPEIPPKKYLFMGIKTGDVNGNASPNLMEQGLEVRSPAKLQIPDRILLAGEEFEIPLSTTLPSEWIGCQWELRWDPNLMEINQAEPGRFPGAEQAACIQPVPGVLRFNWFDSGAQWLFPDAPMLYLKGKAKTDLRLSTILQVSKTGLAAEAYTEAGGLLPLELDFELKQKQNGGQTVYPPQPNPTREGAVFPINLEKPSTCILELWNPTGQLIFQNETIQQAGAGKLEIPEAAILTPGVYAWRIQVGHTTKTGRLLRL